MVSISRTPLRRTSLLGAATFLGLVSLAAQTIKVEVPATVIKGRPFQLVYLLQGSAELGPQSPLRPSASDLQLIQQCQW